MSFSSQITPAGQFRMKKGCEIRVMKRGSFLVSPEFSTRVQSAPLALTVAKLAYRRVIRKADTFGCRPFRVLSPVIAITSGIVATFVVSLSAVVRRLLAAFTLTSRAGFRRKLSAVSLSRAAWVNGCCFRSGSRASHSCASSPCTTPRTDSRAAQNRKS